MRDYLEDELYEWTHKVKSVDTGRLETKKAFEYRQWWQDHNCPPLQQVADHFKTTRKNIDDNYCKKYGWFKIRDKKQELDATKYNEKFKNEQKEIVSDLQKTNRDRLKILKSRRNTLLIEVGAMPNPQTNNFEPTGIDVETGWKEIYEIDKRISQVQKDLLSSYRIPEKVNDKQIINGEIKNNASIKLETKSKEELDKEYEAKFEEYLKNITSNNEGDV